MKKNTSLKVFKIATAGLALTAAASPVYAQVLPTSQVAYAAVTVNNVTDLIRAINNAQAGEVITISPNFSESVTETNAGGTTLKIAKDVTIQGSGNTLTLRGVNLETSGNVVINNLNLAMIGSGSAAGTITSTGGTLTLDNITTKISDQQSGTRPAVYTNGGNITIINGTDETKFDKIVDNGTTATAINLESSNIVVTNGVTLQDNTTVKTASNFTGKFTGPGNVEFTRANIVDVELSNVENVTTADGAVVTLKSSLANPATAVTGKVNVEDGSKLNVLNNSLNIKELAGTGDYYMQHDAKLTVGTITESTNIQIQKTDINYSAYENKVYIQATTVNAVPVVTFNNDPSGLKLNHKDTIWVLEKSEELKKDELTALTDEAYDSAEINDKADKTTPELKKQFEDARDAADAALTSATTQSEIDKALENLKKAIDALSAPVTPPATTQTPTTVAPTTEAPTTQAPTTVAPTTEAPTTVAPTTEAPTTQTPTTVAPTTEAPTTQAPTTVAPTTEAPTTQAPTTVAPTTEAPTTQTPTTVAPTTEAPTTQAPTTVAPTTEAPTTQAPTTVAPTTEAPTTQAPTTVAPTTEAPTTQAPTTVAPTTEAPTTQAPTTVAPTTEAPTTQAPTTVAPTTEAPTTQAPETTVPTTVQTSKAFPATVVDGPEILTVTDITTKVVTEAPVTRIVTEAPVTKIVTEAPVTRIVTEAPVSRIVTDAPVTRIVTEAPVTRFVSNEVSTAVVTDMPLVTQILTEAPATRIVTDAPVTRIETETPVTKVVTEEPVTKIVTEAPATQIISEVVAVTQKGESLTQEAPAIDVNSLVQSLVGQKPTLNLPQQSASNQASGVVGQVPVKSAEQSAKAPAQVKSPADKSSKAEGQKTLPKTSATTNETNSALPAGLAAILVAAGLMVARKENK